MLASLRSAAVFGIEATMVQVEVDVSFGLPTFNMVGLPDTTVRESRDRVRSAIRNSGYEFPAHKITINLAPADIRKAGAAFDLPIAVGVLGAGGTIERRHVDEVLLIGELSLDGAVQPARGVLPIAAAARKEGFAAIVLPRANAAEASLVTGLRVLPVGCLTEAVAAVTAPDSVPPCAVNPTRMVAGNEEGDLAEVRGQLLARRALEIAAAGGHNLLLVGPPGAGKTMIARRMPGILPSLTLEEALDVTAIHSVAGLLPAGTGLVSRRPFRAPHHTISDAALVGGGTLPRPGEISLAHHGVLFLDEMPEFDRRVLEVLRQPLEEGCVRIARTARTAVFPARFVLVAAMNPCPCGYHGATARPCRCSPLQVARYRNRISGPLRDRIDLVVDVPPVPVASLTGPTDAETSSAVRQRVEQARAAQQKRYGTSGALNAGIGARLIGEHCRLGSRATRLIETATTRLGLSARAYSRVLKVARTIADLAGSDVVSSEHVAEALQYRPW